jgi:thiamine pyrophosphate-dependent acetolactate synthase large subunit-like protein
VATCAEVLATTLREAGVERMFGLPGGEILDFIEAARNVGIEFILTRHEAVAAFMADAAGQIARQPAVCVSTLGPGALNLETCVRRRIPFITVVYNDAALSLIRVAQERRGYADYGVRYGLVDFRAASAALGAWSRRVETLGELEEAVRKARLLDVPAVIEVPIDPAEYHAHVR